MEKYCKNCGRVFDDLNFKLCPYCGSELATRYGRQPIPRKLRHEVFKRDGYRCRECGASKDETSLEIDHIVPVARGGTNDIDNLQTLCRECNRMKHTDEWVGGVTDLETAKKELDSVKNQIKKAKNGLKTATAEDEKIEYEYQIMVLEKRLKVVENNYDEIYVKTKQSEAKREREERSKKLYKKLYVKIDENAFSKWAEDNFITFKTKEAFIKHACKYTEDKVNDYIYTCELYEDLINDSQKLDIYNSLYDGLDDKSLEKLKEFSSLELSKGLLILECMNRYGEPKIIEITGMKINTRRIIGQKLKPEQKKLLTAYNGHIPLSVAAQTVGLDVLEVFRWYIDGRNGDPRHVKFYKKINDIKRPTSNLDKNYFSKLDSNNYSNNLTLKEKQDLVLKGLDSFNSLEIAAGQANISKDTVINWYHYGKKGMVEFTNFYKETNKILNSKQLPDINWLDNPKIQFLMEFSYLTLYNTIRLIKGNNNTLNLKTKNDLITYLCDNYSLEELINMF